MERSAWLKEQRRRAEEQEDRLYAPIYDRDWGEISPLHQQFMESFLDLCPPRSHILDAPCGTGKYWPLILGRGCKLYGIDQSQGMLDMARVKFPEIPVEKMGLQEMSFGQTFDGVLCVDALEMVPPEDWPRVMTNFTRALKPGGYFYFTVETTTEQELAQAFADAREAGLPVVYGEWAYEGGEHAEWALEGAYHYYPDLAQVRAWVKQAGFHLSDESAGDEYHHFLAHKPLSD